MTRLMSFFLIATFLTSCANVTVPAQAAEVPNILVMGEDADKDSVPCTSRVFKRVRSALVNQLHDEGFNVYDEAAVTLENFAQGRCRRTDAEVIDIAKKIKSPPIDVVAIFSIYGSKEQLSYTTNLKTRVAGRLLNVKSGQRLGNFEVDSPKEWVAPVDCPRDCLLEEIGKHAKILSNDLGAALGIKLQSVIKKGNVSAEAGKASQANGLAGAYTLVFDGFKPPEISSIEEYLVAFGGYKHHRPITCGQRYCEFWYETGSDVSRLNRNFRMMIERLDVNALVSFSGSTFTVKKVTTRD